MVRTGEVVTFDVETTGLSPHRGHRVIEIGAVRKVEGYSCYWEIGRLTVEEEQRGAARADYGARLILDISKRLTAEFGKGFDRTNLQHMRLFFLNFQIRDALRRELSWTHYPS
jgi:uncharacterized protein YprB with RNaseH-like and TPR domain